MKNIKRWILLITFFPSICFAFSNITDYNDAFIPLYTKGGDLKIATRYFTSNEKKYFLIVDPNTFKTDVVKAENLYPRNPAIDSAKKVGYFEWRKIKETPYVKYLLAFTKPTREITNAGLTHAISPKNGYFLTVDMCPSIKPFEKDFYGKLVSIAQQKQKAFPVAIAISGLWILGHSKEFNYLLNEQAKNHLAITWVNHSLSHLYFSDLPFDQNFLLFQFTNLKNEVFSVEKLLLAHNQIPSPFIRFPGLVSNSEVLMEVQKLGLIPLGADAWLAKDQAPHNGSIILVHGNSNEHPGIEKVLPILENQQINWLSLRDALL